MHTTSSNCLIDMKSYWAHEHHIIGQCLVDPTEQFFYINIPKNASSWAKKVFHQSGWVEADYIHRDVTSMTGLIFLRDPVERWISGISTWLSGHELLTPEEISMEPILKIIFKKITFDSHTEKQKHFLHSIDTNQSICFYVDNQLDNKLGNWYHNNINHTADMSNFKKENEGKGSRYYQFFKNYVNTNTEVKQRLIDYFAEDFELIEQYRKRNLFYEPTQYA